MHRPSSFVERLSSHFQALFSPKEWNGVGILFHIYSLDSISLHFSAAFTAHTGCFFGTRKSFSLLLRYVDTEGPWKTHGKESIGVPEKRMLDVVRSSVVLLSS